MAEIKLFRLDSTVEELKPSEAALERNLQTCIEKNMQAFFGVRFLRSEYPIANGRMDSIGIDENNCPAIFEYKRSVNENVINQGLFYLSWLLDHKDSFKLLVLESLGMEAAQAIDWSAPCVICIARDFTKYDLHAVEVMRQNIKLVKYKKYADGLILFEHLNAPNVHRQEWIFRLHQNRIVVESRHMSKRLPPARPKCTHCTKMFATLSNRSVT